MKIVWVMAGFLLATGTLNAVAVEEAPAHCARHTVGGRPIAVAAARDRHGQRTLLLLVGRAVEKPAERTATPLPAPSCTPSAEQPAAPSPYRQVRLVRVGATSPNDAEALREDLPLDARALVARDLDGDGADELLIGTDQGIEALWPGEDQRFAGPLKRLVDDPRLNWSQLYSDELLAHGSSLGSTLLIGGVGKLYHFDRTPEMGWGLRATTSLPTDVRQGAFGLLLTTPALERVGQRADGHTLYALAPQVVHQQRLRVTLIDPQAPAAQQIQEIWLRLPSREKLHESHYLFDGTSVWLAVTTTPAGDASLLREKLLRLYRVEGEKTRGGTAAAIALESKMNLWQNASFSFVDVTGDGRRDLVVGYWKGLIDDTVALDVYVTKEDGTVYRAPRQTRFDVEEGDRSLLRFGDDLTGDRRPDLVVRAGGRLQVHAGLPTGDGRDLVAAKPRWTLATIPGGNGSGVSINIGASDEGLSVGDADDAGYPLIVVDLDGDGNLDIAGLAPTGADDTDVAICVLTLPDGR